MDLAPDFDEFCALLTACDVEFVIVGAHALAFHGAPRFTGDLDILVRPTEENGRRTLAAIAEFGFPTAPLTAADTVGGTKVIEKGGCARADSCHEPDRRVTWDEVWASRDIGSVGPRAVAFIGREADLADVEALREPDS